MAYKVVSELQVLAGAASGKVLTSDAAGNATWQDAAGGGGGGDVYLAANNEFTGQNTFTNRAEFDGQVNANVDLNVEGETSLNDELYVSGSAYFYNNVRVDGEFVAGDYNFHIGSDMAPGGEGYVLTLADSGKAEWAAPTGGGGVQKYVGLIGDGDLTSFNVQHNLDTVDVVVQVVSTDTNAFVTAGVTIVNANNVEVEFVNAPDEDEFKVIVVG